MVVENGRATEVPSSRTPDEVQVDVYQALGVIIKYMQQLLPQMEQHAAPARTVTEEDQVVNIVNAFKMLSPPVFKGGSDIGAENWLEEVKKILDVLGVVERRMVSLASYTLRGEANHWWDMVKKTQNVTQMTWDEFEEVFLKRYIPESTRIQKRAEFNELIQGNLSVAEYDAKFSELCRHVSQIASDEHMKAQKFQLGLKPIIRRQFTALGLCTYGEVVKRALLVESVLSDICRLRHEKSGESSQGANKIHPTDTQQQCTEQNQNVVSKLTRAVKHEKSDESSQGANKIHPTDMQQQCTEQNRNVVSKLTRAVKHEKSAESSQDANKNHPTDLHEQCTEKNQNVESVLNELRCIDGHENKHQNISQSSQDAIKGNRIGLQQKCSEQNQSVVSVLEGIQWIDGNDNNRPNNGKSSQDANDSQRIGPQQQCTEQNQNLENWPGKQGGQRCCNHDEPEFMKVKQLKPGTSGHNLKVKVISSKIVWQKYGLDSQLLHQTRVAECLVGDKSGSIIFTARSYQVDVMRPGTTVILHNAKIDMFKPVTASEFFMRLAVDKLGRVEVSEPATFVVNEDNNLSRVEYELVKTFEE